MDDTVNSSENPATGDQAGSLILLLTGICCEFQMV